MTFLIELLKGQKNLHDDLREFKRFRGALSQGELGKLTAPIMQILEKQVKIEESEIRAQRTDRSLGDPRKKTSLRMSKGNSMMKAPLLSSRHDLHK